MKNYIRFVVITLIALWLINVLGISYPIRVTTSTTSAEFSISGDGKVDAIPDTALLTTGIVVTNAKTAKAAQDDLNEKNNALGNALIKQGVELKDIQTTQYSVYPIYDNSTSGTQKVTGYNGSVSISIRTRKLGTIGELLTVITEAGANQVQGVEYTIDDISKYRSQARERAIANAKEQAKQVATNTGIKLGKIINIVESGSGMPQPYQSMMGLERSDAKVDSANLQPGSQTITSSVTVFFEKK